MYWSCFVSVVLWFLIRVSLKRCRFLAAICVLKTERVLLLFPLAFPLLCSFHLLIQLFWASAPQKVAIIRLEIKDLSGKRLDAGQIGQMKLRRWGWPGARPGDAEGKMPNQVLCCDYLASFWFYWVYMMGMGGLYRVREEYIVHGWVSKLPHSLLAYPPQLI